VILASVGHWLTQHPEYADWSVAAGTFALAVATFVLARQARSETEEVTRQAGISASQVDVSRAALATDEPQRGGNQSSYRDLHEGSPNSIAEPIRKTPPQLCLARDLGGARTLCQLGVQETFLLL